MSRIYDNWERLVAATLKKDQLWQLFHEQSRSPSIRSEASDFSSSSSLGSPIHDVAFDFSSSSTFWEQTEEKEHAKLVLVSDFSPPLDVSELLGRGTFGSVYTAAMVNGVKIVVRRLKPLDISELEFERHMEIVRNVRHENVVALRAYYCSEDARLMLYDHYSEGSVRALFHGNGMFSLQFMLVGVYFFIHSFNINCFIIYFLLNYFLVFPGPAGENRAIVEWETRLRIAIGAAKGIAEIHAQSGGNLVHGNIKSSNIFLNSEQYGCISDLGLTNMMATQFMPTEWCYAPEVRTTRNISQSSDVYSFGVLILELLTRKSAIAVDLVKLVTSVKSKAWAAKVFDVDLLKNPEIKDRMVKMLQIGVSCVAKSLKKRPKMSAVVRMLEDITITSRLENTSTSMAVKLELVFVEGSKPKFNLEDILRADAEVLGKGTFGTSYKATLEKGVTVVVKRLKDVKVTSNGFQQQIEVIRKAKHENVAELKAYHFSREEKLLLFDYYNQGSLSAMLHGNLGATRTHLDWETRLKIAIGAARGIAHIHKQENLKLVHGNIKASNIFLNRQSYGLISDVGSAQLTNPFRPSLRLTAGYCAPEVTDTRKVSQASDVYSFGVVLLELVSGKPSQETSDDGVVISLVKRIQSVICDEWTAEVFDVELLRHGNENVDAMMQLLQIGMDCVAIGSRLRPTMAQVVKMLEEISGIQTEEQSSIELRLNQSSIELRLEDLLEDLLPTLTP
ncbi:hypothetical protein RD792_008915 [Penstemon davidsonii]|uniref:Protein kinase domain-containing protein n=1 Tax=Penstemon davidsonii TaxID=160366 RepID=A0ABR0DAJ9_9LAMI|nr:hypothetical protein RD792_008915 [Penstemon davidsonii]